MSNNTKLLCLFLRAQKINKSSEQGYAMAMVSMVSIIMLSLLAASMTFSNLAKTRTDAFVDGSSAFAVAEAGLNKRGNEFRQKLDAYSGVTKNIDSSNLDTCLGTAIPTGKLESAPIKSGFGCRNYRFNSNNDVSKVILAGNTSLNTGGEDQNTYIAHTLISDKTIYKPGEKTPQPTLIPQGDPFAGLNTAEYRYVLESSGKKPTASKGIVSPVYTSDESAAINRSETEQPALAGDDALLKSVADKKDIAAKKTVENAAGQSSSNINLSMTFINRVVPLFQFGIFYNGDMELNSSSKMKVKGWVHSNANIYVQPAGIEGNEAETTTDFLSKVSAAGNIYNRLDAWDQGIGRTGITRVLLTGKSGDCDTADNCQSIPAYNASVEAPLSESQISAFAGGEVQDGNGSKPAIVLETPEPGFTRKRNYFNNKVGPYFAKADMRLEMVPDRDVTVKTSSTSWTRDLAIIPFNFTSVKTTGAATDICTTTPPAANTDPAETYVDPSREDFSNLKCHKFTKGQLQSLRQPVLVLPKSSSVEDTTLGKPTPTSTPPFPTPPLATPPPEVPAEAAITATQKNQVLRALQVAIAATPTPIKFDDLMYLKLDSSHPCGPEFKRLIRTIFPIDGVTDTNTEIANQRYITRLTEESTASEVAALGNAWFLPAPIQRVERPTQDTNPTERTLINPTGSELNPRKSGFFDRREERWITMLQTNIASLAVWNRDGLYVDATNGDLTLPYVTTDDIKNAAFNNGNVPTVASGVVANSTDGLAFDRSPADATKPASSLQALGLGSSDETEGGLVFYTTVRDDLNGNGTTSATDGDTTVDTTARTFQKDADGSDKIDPYTKEVLMATGTRPILKKKPDNSDYTNDDKKPYLVKIIDYERIYSGNVTKKSPFAFAFSGGDYLPNALLLTSDQAIYIQGNFNNNGDTQALNTASTPSESRLPASVIADTITVLSNECSSIDRTATNQLKVPLSQLKCGIPANIDEIKVKTYDSAKSPMTVNAAFLANTNISKGNYRVGQTSIALADRSYSGGVNNYIRLLENWNVTNTTNDSPLALNYTGSLVSLGAPLEYSGKYRSGGGAEDRTDLPYYNVPFRNFNYDTKFNKVESVPPLTPKASYIIQKNFSRVY
jgi:Tfp pilus assembly protein PilX